MDLPIILITIGLILIIISFFVKDRSHQVERDLEDLSINFFEETNHLHRRMKIIEEELMIDTKPIVKKKEHVQKQPMKPINEILVNQVLALDKSGYNVSEICKRSSLTMEQVVSVLQSKGVKK